MADAVVLGHSLGTPADTGSPSSRTRLLRPNPLETASGVVVGREGRQLRGPFPRSRRRPASSSLAALEAAILPALRRPPCLVSFSGGMDSSFILAVAAGLARREGLAPPVPITWRFAGAPKAEESTWQERVVSALPITDWPLLRADDDLDLVGPVAQRLLRRYGLLYPANLHLHLPIIEQASGGSLLTGVGGDQILTGWRRPAVDAPHLSSIRARIAGTRAMGSRTPQRLLQLARRCDRLDQFPWLHPEVSRQVMHLDQQEMRSEPWQLARRIDWHARRRLLVMACSSLDAVAADHDVQLINPLLDPTFLQALRYEVRGSDMASRSQLLLGIADGNLPTEATAVRPKAHFLEVFLREPTREFVRSWNGLGVAEELVDSARLGDLWSRWPIPGGTVALVQQLWLASKPPSDSVRSRAATTTVQESGAR